MDEQLSYAKLVCIRLVMKGWVSLMKSAKLKGAAALFSAALIWGFSFPLNSMGMEHVDAFTFKAFSTVIAALGLLPLVLLRGRKNRTASGERQGFTRKTVLYGAIIGLAHCVACAFQQMAFYYSTSGKIAFITAVYMLFVPLLGLLLRKRIPLITWACVGAGVVGLFFLCIDPSNPADINRGDMLALIGAVFFAVHILVIEKFAAEADAIQLTFVQFAVSGVINCVLMFLFEQPQMGNVLAAVGPLLYVGLLGGSVGLTFQILGQTYVEATVATLLLSLESVFGVLGGALLLHEMLSGREILGCVIMFAAIILSQLSEQITAKIRQRAGRAVTGGEDGTQ
jgi:drug/metabolite transporter (DMT)-like permease